VLRAAEAQLKQARVHVRAGRRGLELRVDGTLASYYEPGQASTGSVWDAIAAPVLALRRGRPRSVLILGLGGGSAARLIRKLAPQAHIVGVERDPHVVRAARRHFGLDGLGVEVVVGDASAVLTRERRRFDVVIEDIFVGVTQRLQKPDGFPEPGLRLAWKRVARGGVLISNTIHEGPAVARALRALRGPAAIVAVCVLGYHNRIMAAGPASLAATRLRNAMARNPIFARALPNLRLRTMYSAPGGGAEPCG
jgi:spermidine synthase